MRPGTSRRTRWATCCCGARGSGSSTRAGSASRTADGPLAVAQAMAGELDWDAAQVEREVEAWRELARAEGLVPQVDVEPVPQSEPEEPSPAAPGAAPEEAA